MKTDHMSMKILNVINSWICKTVGDNLIFKYDKKIRRGKINYIDALVAIVQIYFILLLNNNNIIRNVIMDSNFDIKYFKKEMY